MSAFILPLGKLILLISSVVAFNRGEKIDAIYIGLIILILSDAYPRKFKGE